MRDYGCSHSLGSQWTSSDAAFTPTIPFPLQVDASLVEIMVPRYNDGNSFGMQAEVPGYVTIGKVAHWYTESIWGL